MERNGRISIKIKVLKSEGSINIKIIESRQKIEFDWLLYILYLPAWTFSKGFQDIYYYNAKLY